MKACSLNKTVVQCKSCPWRIDCVPDRDIPNYVPALHEGLTNTIRSGIETLFETERHTMACHYSKPGEEFPCAGWLSNQLGSGNNIGVRMAVMTGSMPVPKIDGPQHERFEDTLCNSSGRSATKKGSSTRSPRTGQSGRGKRSAGSSPRPNNLKTKRPRASGASKGRNDDRR